MIFAIVRLDSFTSPLVVLTSGWRNSLMLAHCVYLTLSYVLSSSFVDKYSLCYWYMNFQIIFLLVIKKHQFRRADDPETSNHKDCIRKSRKRKGMKANSHALEVRHLSLLRAANVFIQVFDVVFDYLKSISGFIFESLYFGMLRSNTVFLIIWFVTEVIVFVFHYLYLYMSIANVWFTVALKSFCVGL